MHAPAAAARPLTDTWYMVAVSRSIRAGAMQRIILADTPISVGRTREGKAFAVRDICPHRAAMMSTGRVCHDNTVECPYHGWRFNVQSGVCQHIPALGENASTDTISRFKLHTLPVHEHAGCIWVYLSSSERKHLPPAVLVPDLPPLCHTPALVERITLDCDIDNAVVGLMDPAHGPFVHQSFFWRNRGSIHAKSKEFAPYDRGFVMCAHKPSRNAAAYKLLGGDINTRIAFLLPGVRIEEINTPRGSVVGLTTLLPHTVPNETARTTICQIFYTNVTVIKLLKPLLRFGVRHFLRQDARIMQQQAQNMPFFARMMLLDDADTQAKWYYKLRREHEASLQENRAFCNPVPHTTLHWYS